MTRDAINYIALILISILLICGCGETQVYVSAPAQGESASVPAGDLDRGGA